MDENRVELVEEAAQTTTPARNPNKILWWNQKHMNKEEMTKKTNFWKKKWKNGAMLNN